MKSCRVLKLNQEVRIKKGEEEGVLLHARTDFVYEASNDILDFIQLFDGAKTTDDILAETQTRFSLSTEEVDHLHYLIQELVTEEILI